MRAGLRVVRSFSRPVLATATAARGRGSFRTGEVFEARAMAASMHCRNPARISAARGPYERCDATCGRPV